MMMQTYDAADDAADEAEDEAEQHACAAD